MYLVQAGVHHIVADPLEIVGHLQSGPDEVAQLLVGHNVPDAVAGQNHKLVLLRARDTASEPFTLWIITEPPAFWMRSFSRGLQGLWSSVEKHTCALRHRTARESPQLMKKRCSGDRRTPTAVDPLRSTPFRRSEKLRICSSMRRNPARIPVFTASTVGWAGAVAVPPEELFEAGFSPAVVGHTGAGVAIVDGEEGPVGHAGGWEPQHRRVSILHLNPPALHGAQAVAQPVALAVGIPKRTNIVELKDTGETAAGGRKKMQDILLGLKQQADRAEGGMESVLREVGLESDDHGQAEILELLSRLAELQHSGAGDVDAEIEVILTKLEEIGGRGDGNAALLAAAGVGDMGVEGEKREEEDQDLADRLSGLDLDSLSEEAMWGLLSSQEKEGFVNVMKGKGLEQLLPLWRPWWEEHEEGRVSMIEVFEGASSCDNTLNTKEGLDHLCDTILDVSQALNSNKVFESLQQALECGEAAMLAGGYLDREDPCAKDRAIEAVAHIMTGRSRQDTMGYCLAALSQLRAALSKARASLPKGEAEEKRRKYFLAGKKCEFYQAWVADNGQQLRTLAIGLWQEHSKRTTRREALEREKRAVEDGWKKGNGKGNRKLIEELN
ncbi:hypothetical protein CRUP_000555 [Coryphaenoides rupestris]|nr:hypothetical protein CRUP_000555 [Coryphaenoides rupestris]